MKLWQVLNESDDGIIVVDNDKGDILYSNPQIIDMFGYEDKELQNLTIYDLFPEQGIRFWRKNKKVMFGMTQKCDKFCVHLSATKINTGKRSIFLIIIRHTKNSIEQLSDALDGLHQQLEEVSSLMNLPI
jgi:PAS domain S-box-containing protein